MIKLFFATFFIAELIIAISLIFKIYQFNKRVNILNSKIKNNKYKIEIYLSDFRIFLEAFEEKIAEYKKLIREKRDEYSFKIIKTLLIYMSIFFLKGKYKKSVIVYQFLCEVYDGIQEAGC